MTHDEKVAYQREAAALIMASMSTARGYKLPPPNLEPKARTSRAEKARLADARKEWERQRHMERMHMAQEAFALAGALLAESELWAGPMADDGEPIDPRAMDRECVHGRKMSEACPECDQRAQAAKEGKPAEAVSGEGTDEQS